MQIIFDTDKDDAKAAQALVAMVNSLYAQDIFNERKLTLRAAHPELDAQGDAPATDAPRDAAGVAWDARVHTSNQATKQDGTWKRKPGLDDEFYESVMSELTAQADTPAVTEEADTPVASEEADTPAASEEADTPAAAAFAPPPPHATVEPTPDEAPAHSFLSNMQTITRKQLGKAAVDAELAKAGIEGIAGLVAASPAKQAEVAALLEAL